ncbi:RagB/SusD family nutrient uptake outer membrane protein [Sphingobacterium sp. 1.A.5]|uniref:RagB/SusD family nutrient uptake outer membrane protein n=1 Tax=Sphingobacterium sp. 1.A.5 TaxID=2044604 RepID=UPI000C0BFE2F|nr:RagB/SusD family nutrient uptake outer membrane protein [Sphingobacterium sp. 1.A.5]
MKTKYIMNMIALLTVAVISSCSLNKDPLADYSDVTEGVINEEGQRVVFKDKAAVDTYMQGLYNILRDRQEHWYLDQLLISESHSDNAYAGTTGAEVLPYENNSIEGSNSVVERDWIRYLEDVARANILIVNVDSVNDNSLTTALRKQYKAEAKILRSLIFFDMVRLWGDIPVVTNVGRDITSENIEEVYDDYFPDQKTEKEAYEQIEKDLLEAIVDAPSNNSANKTRFSKSVAKALLAKVYAEKPLRNYAKVVQYVDELAADGFDLEEDYKTLFGVNEGNADALKRNSKESILETQFFSGSGNWVTWMFGRDLSNYNSNFTWAKWITPSRDLINAFTRENDQIRYTESIVYYQATWSNYYPASNYPFMYKTRSAYSNIIKLRYADLLLLKAEALINGDSQNLTAAAEIIDRIRQRVKLPRLSNATKANKESMLTALLNERRLELAFEGQRWYDLVRLNKVESVMNAVFAKDSGRKALVYPFNENSYRLPVPQSIIDENPKIVQNPGY